MNVTEGMRRTGILLGIVGGLLGGVVAYSEGQSLWTTRAAHLRFESLMAQPIAQKVAKAAQDYQRNEEAKYWKSTNPLTYSEGQVWETLPEASPKFVPPSLTSDDQGFVVSVNLDGIKTVVVDRAGHLSSIQLSTGESVARTEPPQLTSYLRLLLYPMLGFLLPWGTVRILSWVAMGFAEPRH